MTMAGDADDKGKLGKNVVNLIDAAQKKQRAKKKQPPPDDTDDGRPVITVAAGKRPKILDQADEVLGKNDGRLFDHVGRLVRLTQPGEVRPSRDLANVRRQANAIVLHEVTAANLCDRLARVARWRRWDARAGDYVTCDVPTAVAEGLLARSGEWRHIPPLRGFVEAPCLRDDGSVFDVPGYDADSELFFSGTVPDGYTTPIETRSAASAAVDWIVDLVSDLPFVSVHDKSAFISGIITALVRRVLPSAPLIGITAPTPGTGKSMVADAMSIIATGRRAAVIGLGKDDIEADKRLTGALLAGDPVIAIDNIERPIFGDLICQTLTQPSIRIRALGRSELADTPTNTTLIATANNLDVRGDLRRRVMLVRLDAKTERPELREFTRDFLADVLANRGKLVTAALTLVRAYIASGERAKVTPFGSFEAWSRWCREPLVWVGLTDPLEASKSLVEQDPDLKVQKQLFAAWSRIFGEAAVTATTLINAAMGDLGAGITSDPELKGALEVVCNEKIAARRLSYWLRRHRERMLDGMRLESAGEDNHTKVDKWRLIKLDK